MASNLSATSEEKRILASQFPLITQISNEELRDMVIETWVRLWRESGYQNIGEAPNTLSEEGGDETLVGHTNAVVRVVMAAAEQLQQVYPIKLNRDFLLAGAFLHDVDKIVIYERKGNLVEFSERGHQVSHGAYGASVAEQIGLPPEVVNIVASHTPERPTMAPATIEAVLVGHCDLAVYQSFRLMKGMGVYDFG